MPEVLFIDNERQICIFDKIGFDVFFVIMKGVPIIATFAVRKNYKYLQRSARKYRNVTVVDFRKYEKLEYEKNILKSDIDFLSSCKQLGVYPKFLIFKLLKVSKKDALSVRKRLLRSTIKKLNKELRDLSKEFSLSGNLLSTQLSTIEFYILTKYKTLHNKKLLQKWLCTQQKKLSSLTSDRKLPTFIPNENISDLTQ